jgi:L-aspartate oxidase
VVARAIHEEMLAQHTPCVYLDITHKPADWIRERFPNIHRRCLEAGIDMTKMPIPVVPAAHYSCGGVATDLRGRTSLDRLWAVGEVACTGLHGANRLASTSLLEGLVWGHEAGLAIAERLGEKQKYSPLVDEWKHEKEPVDPALIYQDWLTIRYTMWNYVGLARSRRRLNRARHILRELQMEVEDFYLRAALTDDMVGLRNGVQTALAVLFAASENRQSIGCHYRID